MSNKKTTKSTNANTTYETLPGVLSFQRLMNVSDGLMYNHFAAQIDPENAADGVVPVSQRSKLMIVRHGIRGTQNVDKQTEVSNIQTTESGKTDAEADGFEVEFSMWFSPLDAVVTSCASFNTKNQSMREDINNFLGAAVKQSVDLTEVCNRYARNVLNGSWLWKRNRLLGQSIAITATVLDNKVVKNEFKNDGLEAPLTHFKDFTKDEIQLGEVFRDMLAGVRNTRVTVNATVLFGFQGSVEVFPSQNYLGKNPKTKIDVSRSLFKVMARSSKTRHNNDTNIVGWAAMRDQKIANAIRTIDTWYKSSPSVNKPIPVEPNGANLDDQVHYRLGKGDSSFEILRDLGSVVAGTDNAKFLIAALIRGGVYSESKKDPKTDNTQQEETPNEV